MCIEFSTEFLLCMCGRTSWYPTNWSLPKFLRASEALLSRKFIIDLNTLAGRSSRIFCTPLVFPFLLCLSVSLLWWRFYHTIIVQAHIYHRTRCNSEPPCLIGVHPSWCTCLFHTVKWYIFSSLYFMIVSSSSSVSWSSDDRILVHTWSKCPLTVDSLLGRYLATNWTVSPDHDWKYPFCISLIHVDLNGMN